MIKIITILLISLALGWVSELETKHCRGTNRLYQKRTDIALILLCILLSIFSGSRTDYNDTWNYKRGFLMAPSLSDYLSDSSNYSLFHNFLFGFFQSLLKTFTNEPQVMIFLTAAFTQTCMILFLKRYSERFTFSIFLYFAMGTFTVTLAAIKQTVAMAILTLGFPLLEQKKFSRFFLVVFIAMQFHTYAVCFAVLPLFIQKPWRSLTFLFMGAVLFVLSDFNSIMLQVMEQANEVGKNLEAYEVLDSHTVNLFRVAVYAVPPLFSLVFARWINQDSTPRDNLLIHMSIISLAFMMMGTKAGANMFARMAHYFEIGTLCSLPNTIDKPFAQSSMRLVYCLAILGFLGFFAYANQGFDNAYKTMGIFGLF